MNEQELEISNICKTKRTYAFAREIKFESEFPFFSQQETKGNPCSSVRIRAVVSSGGNSLVATLQCSSGWKNKFI